MKVTYPVRMLRNSTAALSGLVLACLAALVVAVACGGDQEASRPTGTPAATSAATAAARAPGVTDTEIVLGTHAMLSGPKALLVDLVPKAEETYFKYVNEARGGVCGRKIVFKLGDSQGDPARALEVVRRLVEQDQVFAIVGGVGDMPHAAVWGYLNERGVPDLFIIAGGYRFGSDPQGHPWSVQLLPDFRSEGTSYGQYISENLAGKKVAVLYENDDLGQDGLAGLKAGLDPTKNQIVAEESYEVTDVDIRPQIIRMANTGAEVAVLHTAGGFTAQAIKAADRLGWHPRLFTTYVNADDSIFTFLPPELVNGLISTQGMKMASWTDDPAIAQHYEIMRTYGGPTPSLFTIFGQAAAELTVEVLNRACANLTRKGVMDAVLSLKDYRSDLFVEGLSITYGDTDRAAFERGMRLVVATVENGKGKWEYLDSPTHDSRINSPEFR